MTEKITRVESGLHFAKFYLSKTIEALNNENVEYEPYLNAFVLFARATGFSLEKQYSKCKGYEEWNKDNKNKYEEIFGPFTKLRNVIEKEGIITPKLIHQNVSFGKGGVTGRGREIVDVTFANGACTVTKTLDGVVLFEKEYPIDYDLVISEGGKNAVVMENFIKESKLYLEALENIINDAKNRFGA